MTQEVTGFSEADVRGRGCLCLAGPLTDGYAARTLLRAHRSDRPHAARLLCYRRSGEPLWCATPWAWFRVYYSPWFVCMAPQATQRQEPWVLL